MKKVLMILGIVFVVLIALFAGLLIWAQASGAKIQEQFFAAVLSGDPKQVTAMFHPALCEEVDEPVLGAWMAEVKGKLGAVKGLRKTNFSTSSKIENGVTITESKGIVDFEKGSAESELKFYAGKLVKFNVTSDKISGSWFTGPASTDLYRERGKEFLTRFLANKPDEAFAMMYPALQNNLPLDKLKAMIEKVTAQTGPLKSIDYASEKITPGEVVSLKVLYKVECEKDQTVASVKFQFVGLKGHLVAFNLTGE